MSVRIETNIGNFFVNLFTEDAPKASFNFLKLCKLNYYAYSIFLRCEAGFLLQGGDPSNTGRGGESIWQLLNPSDKSLRFFADEIDVKRHRHKLRGTLSMAAAGKDKNASQFFFTLADDLEFLDGTCTIFGQLTGFERIKTERDLEEEGVEDKGVDKGQVISLLSVDTEEFFDYFNNEVFCDEGNRPFQDVFIKRTVVLSDPFPDPETFANLPVKSSDEPSESFLKHKRIGAHESLDDYKDKTEEELEAEMRERTAEGNALVLEIIGDLPSADVKPPENVLFVCKLNPITQSDDLKMIFSRFGPIVSCEVIRDRDTSASLGYAFIEFEEKESCEQAYLKMDNVLIDDRRVKVDFSQSVSKLHRQWVNKRRGVKDEDYRRSHREKDSRDSRETRQRDRDYRETRDSRETRGYKNRDYKDSRDSRDYRYSRDSRDHHHHRERSKSPRRRY